MKMFVQSLLASVVLMSTAQAGSQAILHKNPNCGCCDEYAKILEQNGYTVKLQETTDLPSVRMKTGVPEALAGCHTMIIDGYIIEGLVPINVVDRLLKEKPKIRGISLPGMPVGAPGMPGPKEGPFKIYEIEEGEPSVYAIE